MEQVTAQFSSIVAQALLGLFAIAVTALINSLRKKYNSETATKLLDLAQGCASTVVADLEQTMVAEIKAASADGVLTKEEMETIMQRAVQRTRLLMGNQAKQLDLHTGGASSAEVAIRSMVEAAVLRNKNK